MSLERNGAKKRDGAKTSFEAIVSDPHSTSRTARESLARGLNALQADPSVPSHLVDLASPIAQAMGALHQLERTNLLVPHAEVALNHVRGALTKLQSANSDHPAVNAALESVAKSLSLVHALSKMANGPVQPAPQPRVQPAPQQQPAAAAPPAAAPPGWNAPTGQANAGGPSPHASPHAQPPPGFHQQPSFPQAQAPVHHPASPPANVARDPFAASDPFAAPRGAAPQQQAPVHAAGPSAAHGVPAHAAPQPAHASPARPGGPTGANAPPLPGGAASTISADLGAHSPTNFYKGLAGNDIIDHGGLFVSTYVPPKIGSAIRLRVSLPGGYEFEANAVVRWTRDQGGDAPPGFGAQFTAITNEARQLVYRYVRNREPIFYDDF